MQGNPQSLAVVPATNTVYALYERNIYLINDGVVTKISNTLFFEARAIAVNTNLNEVYVGDFVTFLNQDGIIHVFDLELNYVSKFAAHMNEVTRIRISNDNSMIATADSKKNVYIWSAETKESLIDRFVFHSAKVFDIDWSADDKFLVSSSLDRSIILWNIKEKTKVKVFEDIDHELVTSVKFIDENTIICGGHSCVLKKLKL